MTSPWLRVVDGSKWKSNTTGDLLKTVQPLPDRPFLLNEDRDFHGAMNLLNRLYKCRILEERTYLSHFVSIIFEGWKHVLKRVWRCILPSADFFDTHGTLSSLGQRGKYISSCVVGWPLVDSSRMKMFVCSFRYDWTCKSTQLPVLQSKPSDLTLGSGNLAKTAVSRRNACRCFEYLGKLLGLQVTGGFQWHCSSPVVQS